MSINLPGLNFDSKLSIQDLIYQSNVDEQAILNRMTLMFGSPALTSPMYGIVDSLNPADVVSSDTTRPLLVTVSTQGNTLVDVTAGYAVCQNGTIVHLPSLTQGFVLASTNINDVLVLFAENSIIDGSTVRTTIYNVPQPVQRIQNTVILKSDLMSNFNNGVLYPSTRMANIVVIAIITVVTSTTSISGELQIDMTQNSYTYNRPWFSPVDIAHRSYLGTGLVTPYNIHGLSLSDLTAGNFTLYDQFLHYGTVQSKDEDWKGIPGYYCQENISAVGRILQDTTGAVTSRSRFGGPNAWYVTLSAYPSKVLSFYSTEHASQAIAYDWIPGSRIVVLAAGESALARAANSVIEYTRVYGMELPIALLSNLITLTQPAQARELIYTGGITLKQLTNPSINVDGAGPFPSTYTLFANTDGTILQAPQAIDKILLLNNIASSAFNSYQLVGSAYVGNDYITLSSITSLVAGMYIVGPGIPVNTYITSISGNLVYFNGLVTTTSLSITFNFLDVRTPSAVYSISQTMFGPARIKIGLSGAAGDSLMGIAMHVSGLNTSGVSTTETVVFGGNYWHDNPPLQNAVESPSQFMTTQTVFTKITSIQVLCRSHDSSMAYIKLWADLQPGVTQPLNSLARICTFTWNGTSISTATPPVDNRTLVARLKDSPKRYLSA